MEINGFSDVSAAGGPARFVVVEHTADWALWVGGGDFAELLVNAARGMSSLLVAEPDALEAGESRSLTVTAFDRESMLVEWLSELAYLAEREGFVGSMFELESVTPERLVATVRGSRVERLQKHIKAVTYHDLEVTETAEGLETTIVFDV